MILERRDGGGVRRNSQLFSLILKSPLRKYTRKESCKVRAEMCLLSRDDQELVKKHAGDAIRLTGLGKMLLTQ